jgi:hypothetical protein
MARPVRHHLLGALAVSAGATFVVAGPLLAAPVAACGGLVAPNGTVHLVRTTTLAAYHDGVEHYITSFQFEGGGGKFGSIVPLPAVPTKVERAGSWTLQRLELETSPPALFAEAAVGLAGGTAHNAAEVLLQTQIDALDITVLKGGGAAVGDWARQHGFTLTPDAPEMLDYYASRSPIFLAAQFDGAAAAAKSQRIGDGTPIDVTMPMKNPWVPLRILSLGRGATDTIQADVYLLSDSRPALLPAPADVNDMTVFANEPASNSLLSDLRRDKNMGWIPARAWLTEVKVDGPAFQLNHDLAIDASGAGRPSVVQAGLLSADVPPSPPAVTAPGRAGSRLVWWEVAAGGMAAVAVLAGVVAYRRRPS